MAKEYSELELRYNVMLNILFDIAMELNEETIFIGNGDTKFTKKYKEKYRRNRRLKSYRRMVKYLKGRDVYINITNGIYGNDRRAVG